MTLIGASGKIGRRLIELLNQRDDTAIGVVRKPEQVEEIGQLGASGVRVDIETASAEQLAEAFEGSDAAVFVAGAGPGSGPARKRTVDYGGSVLAAEAAALAGVRRFVQISAIGVDNPVPADADETWAAYVAAKRDADTALRSTGLDWTILRPGGLTDEPGTGRVTLAETVERGAIPRDDVAALVLAVLADPATIGHQWEAVSGPRSIADAIAAALA